MDADKALEFINKELAVNGKPPLVMTPEARQLAYNGVLQYAHVTQRPIEMCLQDVVRYQLQSEQLDRLRSQQ